MLNTQQITELVNLNSSHTNDTRTIPLKMLDPRWMSLADNGNLIHTRDPRPTNPIGLHLLCPLCWMVRKAPIIAPKKAIERVEGFGVHAAHCLSPQAPADMLPLPGRWNLIGDTLDELSLKGKKGSSVQFNHGCKAHFLIKNGVVKLLGE